MLHPLSHIRGHVYPRFRVFDPRNSGRLHASEIILGMLLVMLAILGLAYAMTLISRALSA